MAISHAILIALGTFFYVIPVSAAIPFGYTFSHEFLFSGESETFDVPSATTQLYVELCGAAGGNGEGEGEVTYGGLGGCISVLLPVTSSEKLVITVGGIGGNAYSDGTKAGFNGGGESLTNGGGGGASDIRKSGGTLNDRIVVAGGGGGGTYSCGAPSVGGNGVNPNGSSICIAGNCGPVYSCAGGGSQSSGGSAGINNYVRNDNNGGSFGYGGNALFGHGGGGGGGWYSF
jgi:hypothetical protein